MRNTARMLVLSVLLMAGIAACSDPESAARVLHNQAITAEKEGRTEDAKAIYEQIVDEYPQTATAIDANKWLLSSEKVGGVLDALTSVARSHQLEKQKKILEETLDMYRLITGRYPTEEEGLSALISRPEGAKIWKGPYLEGEPEQVREMLSQFTYRIDAEGRPVVEIK
ncbi:type II secretion system protein GspG [Thiohalocapsa marina]|uniref:type II secretion system protein GspG n=1 Tax=Thiohalocapsa marina TaxID=424902 RepID=UPI0036D84C21